MTQPAAAIMDAAAVANTDANTDAATLPDYLRPGLDIVLVGLNPSAYSARVGHYFANPRNRFWPAVSAAYGWDDDVLADDEEILRRLLALNLARA